MIKNLKLVYENNRNIIRITGWTLVSLVLLFLTWLLDYKCPGFKDGLPNFLLLSSGVTSSFLSTLAGTFLTVTTFTFTTILTVLNKYSDSFTPRIVQDFIDKPHVLSLFGVFIGGFFYTVLSLFLVENASSDDTFISGTIAIFYAVIAMISFVLFVKRVLNDIKVSNVIENTYAHALKLIETELDAEFPDDLYAELSCETSSDSSLKSDNSSSKSGDDSSKKEHKIFASKSGYFYSISSDEIIKVLDGIDSDLVIRCRIGEFLLKDEHIASLYVEPTSKDEHIASSYVDANSNNDISSFDEILDKVSDCLLINVRKNDTEDYHHEITNLVEIAMKGLSPGINDPNTAIESVRKIGILLGKLFSAKHFYRILNKTEDTRIIYTGYTAKEELHLSFNQILYYGKNDPLVSEAILKSIRMIYLVAGESMHSQIRDFFDYCYDLCSSAMDNEMYKERLEVVRDNFYSD